MCDTIGQPGSTNGSAPPQQGACACYDMDRLANDTQAATRCCADGWGSRLCCGAHQLAKGAGLPGQQRRAPGGVGAAPQLTMQTSNALRLGAHQLAEGADLPGQQRRAPGGVGAVPQLIWNSLAQRRLPPLPPPPRLLCFLLPLPEVRRRRFLLPRCLCRL